MVTGAVEKRAVGRSPDDRSSRGGDQRHAGEHEHAEGSCLGAQQDVVRYQVPQSVSEARAIRVFVGENTDPWGNVRAGFSASTVINRHDYGLSWNKALETGGVVVGDDVTIRLEVQGIRQ